MLIVGLNKTTLLDYPGRVAATVFTGGCNFRCPFCHNGDLVLKPSALDVYSEEEVFSFLEKRKRVLKGVCITGGEPTLQTDLPEFISKVKKMGYAVKLDTNGYRPDVLRQLLKAKLLDYVAMDIKNCKEKYPQTTKISDFQIEKVEESIELLKEAGIFYEFRTTVVKEFHTPEDLLNIARWISGCSKFYLQQYQENEHVISAMLSRGEETVHSQEGLHAYQKEELEEMIKRLNALPGMSGKVLLRGVM